MENIPIEQMDIRRLRVELSSALTANKLLLKANERLEERDQWLDALEGEELIAGKVMLKQWRYYERNKINHKLKEVLGLDVVDAAMMSIAEQIYEIGFPLAIVAILKGGAYTAYEILKLLDYIYVERDRDPRKVQPDIVIGHIGLESYGDEMKSQGEVKLMTPLDLSRECIYGRNVIIIDDCIETGNTLEEAKKIIAGYNPSEILTAVLADKVTLRRNRNVEQPNIIGWSYTGTGFLVGCGMGAGERYRELPCICEVVEDNNEKHTQKS